MRVCDTLLLLTACCVASVACNYIPVIVEESGAEYVEKFSTVVHFFLNVTNNGPGNVRVTVTPTQCCLVITKEDINCQVIELKPPVNLTLGARMDQSVGSNRGRAVFMFRNLYTRYRKGNCSFEITVGEDVSFSHSLNFNTVPNDPEECFGMDQDPDRGCVPVDCAIKYKGHRNFYRNATGKCEKVVQCDTRGPDGVEIIAFYDWDSNACRRLDFEENSFTEFETVPEIPASIDPSQTKYFPNLKPQHLENIAEGNERIECSHGVQNGMYCECDDGWISSGVHQADPLVFHWCDEPMMDANSISGEPIKPSKSLEVFVVIVLSMMNIALTSLWLYLGYTLFLKERCQHACAQSNKPSYTLLEPN